MTVAPSIIPAIADVIACLLRRAADAISPLQSTAAAPVRPAVPPAYDSDEDGAMPLHAFAGPAPAPRRRRGRLTVRVRGSSRLLILDGQGRLLLFRFEHRRGPRAGQVFWATPGGEAEPGESFEAAAVRKLFEETGLTIDDPGPEVGRRTPMFQHPEGEWVQGDERFFVIRIDTLELCGDGWEAIEQGIMAEHRWWSPDDLAATTEIVRPQDIASLIP
jgi:8-oxo-dGTP pyrophosphatase MutT (NUDIX family)